MSERAASAGHAGYAPFHWWSGRTLKLASGSQGDRARIQFGVCRSCWKNCTISVRIGGVEVVGDGRADDVEVVAVLDRDAGAVGLAGGEMAGSFEVEAGDVGEQCVRLGAETGGLVGVAEQLLEGRGSAHAPDVRSVEARDLVGVRADAFEQVVDLAVVGEVAGAAEPLPGLRPSHGVVGDGSPSRPATPMRSPRKSSVAGEAHVVVDHPGHRVVVDRVPPADGAAGERGCAEVGVDVAGDPVAAAGGA